MNIIGKCSLERPGSDLIKIDQDYFPQPWSEQQWLGMDRNQHLLFTFRLQNQLVGYALFGLVNGDDVAHLYKILIIPKKRGEGTSGRFWSCIKQELLKKGVKTIYLEVEASNGRAIGFYHKKGFQILRKSKGYYSTGEDALIMTLTL